MGTWEAASAIAGYLKGRPVGRHGDQQQYGNYVNAWSDHEWLYV